MTTNQNHVLIDKIKSQLDIVADISRAEALLYTPLLNNETTVIAHAHPHSVAPAYLKIYTGVTVNKQEMPTVFKALSSGRKQQGHQGIFGDGASVIVTTWPIYHPDPPNRIIGAISIDSSLLEHERQNRRSRPFQYALNLLQIMLTKGQLEKAETLSPFGEHEGLMVVDKTGCIQYTSGVVASLYRRIGYLDNLVGRQLDSLHTHDDHLFSKVATTLACSELETEDGGRLWIRKAIPILGKPSLKTMLKELFKTPKTQQQLHGVLLIINDITEEKRQEQEIKVKNAMIQEIHHRVKNNLQTIAALLRIQNRRIDNQAASLALKDAINRILSVAVIHEFLSDQGSWTINMKEVCQRIITQTQASIVRPETNIQFELTGSSIWLPPRQATACALVINELLQNALEHAFEHERTGTITLILTDEGDHVIISINDDGHGLPDNFDPNMLKSLGLQIAQTLVTEDLQGKLSLLNNSSGTTAKITFSKQIFSGEEGWNANV